MRLLNNQEHETLWHLCNRIVVEAAGARAAMLCDAIDGNVLISVGETGQSGAPTGVKPLGPGERLVSGEGGNVYGVDLPNRFMLAVLHDGGALEAVRAAVGRATSEFAEVLLASAPPPPAAPPSEPRKKAAIKKKKAPARKEAGARKVLRQSRKRSR